MLKITALAVLAAVLVVASPAYAHRRHNAVAHRGHNSAVVFDPNGLNAFGHEVIDRFGRAKTEREK